MTENRCHDALKHVVSVPSPWVRNEPILGSENKHSRARRMIWSLIKNGGFLYRQRLIVRLMDNTSLVRGVACIVVNYATCPNQVIMADFVAQLGISLADLEIPFGSIRKLCRRAFEITFENYLMLENEHDDARYKREMVCKRSIDCKRITVGGAIQKRYDHELTLNRTNFIGIALESRYSEY